MTARRFSRAGLAALAAAFDDAGTVSRWREKTVAVPGSECLWWTAAISGRGRGRFYYASGRVIIAHRFAFEMVHRVEHLERVPGPPPALIRDCQECPVRAGGSPIRTLGR